MQSLVVAAAGLVVGLILQGCGNGTGHHPTPLLPKACATTTTTTPSGNWTGYSCSSTRELKSKVKAVHQKGFAVDDATFATCSEQLVAHWPHCPEQQRVNSLRLFSAWKKRWNQELRQQAWDNLKAFLDNNKAKVLLGVDLFCETENDEWEWSQALDLLKFLGNDRVMGLAFGNEMDNKNQCREGFKNGNLFTQMKRWVDAMDAIGDGFDKVPVTVVWAMGVLGKTKGHAFDPELEPFLTAAHKEWHDRFVWTFNPYPLWDASIVPKSAEQCEDMIKFATGDYTRTIMGVCRGRVTNFTNSTSSLMWAGESGWSSPFVDAQEHIRKFCPDWASEETLFKFYETMMEWDLSVPNDTVTGKPIRGVDHLFFFTMRDFNGESFGLVKECCASECKIQAPTTSSPSSAPDFLAKLLV
jgi:hypothetical protein